MKCDELTEYTNPTYGSAYYDIDEVDAAIAELKQKLEDAKASHYAEMVDAGMRERRLHKALYKACSNWASCKACILEYFCCHKLNAMKWERMLNKCRAKAEEYKR